MNQIRCGQINKYGPERGDIGNILGDVHFEKFAEMLGGHGESVRDPAEIQPALFAGYQHHGEGAFTARRRHVDALQRAAAHFTAGVDALEQSKAGELLAEELRLAQRALGEITGSFSNDELLGRIFSEFCIGK
jgi:hypothetical protein